MLSRREFIASAIATAIARPSVTPGPQLQALIRELAKLQLMLHGCVSITASYRPLGLDFKEECRLLHEEQAWIAANT